MNLKVVYKCSKVSEKEWSGMDEFQIPTWHLQNNARTVGV